MAMVINNKHLWLIGLFWDGKSDQSSLLNLNEISERYYRDFQEELKTRTFHSHQRAIDDILGITIKCNDSHYYYIANLDEIKNNPILQWTIEALSVQMLIKNANAIRNRLLLENIPGGTNFLESIAVAIKRKYVLNINYESYNSGSTQELEVYPIALKTYRRRWYMLAKPRDDDKLRHFALDRIDRLGYVFIRIDKRNIKGKFVDYPIYQTYTYSISDSDINNYYGGAVGIWVTDNHNPEFVTIRAYGIQADYMRKLPLHSSQEEINTTDQYADFKYYIEVNPDLVRDLMSRTDEIEVLKPQSLRDMMKQEIRNMYQRYE